jgi:HAD superfamily hydrolase (TIGR01509 family)
MSFESIIFDFGDVFINLDKEATPAALKKLGLEKWDSEIDSLNFNFEKGFIARSDFLLGLNQLVPYATQEEVLEAWNGVLLEFPIYRLEFLEKLSKKYQLFLLSNTDSIHINHFKEKNGEEFYNRFYNCFKRVYFSFNLGMRKPDEEIYNFVINENNLNPKTTLFVDDNFENIEGAKKTGLQVWHLLKGNEDVIELFEKVKL